MIDRYMRWRNARAQPKTNFAPTSVIRTRAPFFSQPVIAADGTGSSEQAEPELVQAGPDAAGSATETPDE
jgi:hypothetical protein